MHSPWETHPNGEDKPSFQLGGDTLQSLLDFPNLGTDCEELITL